MSIPKKLGLNNALATPGRFLRKSYEIIGRYAPNTAITYFRSKHEFG